MPTFAPQNAPTPVLTLRQVRERTGISLPTLYRYKREYRDRIPAVGEGRLQRFLVPALRVFEQIKRENLAKRGKYLRTPTNQISLAEIARRTHIAYPTLLRYVKDHLQDIPHQGTGYKRRFLPEAVAVFQRLRRETRRGRPPAKALNTTAAKRDLSRRLLRIEEAHARLTLELQALSAAMQSQAEAAAPKPQAPQWTHTAAGPNGHSARPAFSALGGP